MSTILDISVAHGEDDDDIRRQTSTFWYNTSTTLCVGYASNTVYAKGVSMRFVGVNIPAGATILVAHLTLICSNPKSNLGVRTDLCCENASNPGRITSYEDHIGRARTADIEWDDIPVWPTAGLSYQSPSIVTPIQTVVNDQGGTGDALIVFWEDKDARCDAVNETRRIAASFEHVTLDPPAIYIEYSEPEEAGIENKSANMGSKMVAAGLI